MFLDSNPDPVLNPRNGGRVGTPPTTGNLIIRETLCLVVARSC